MRGYNNVFATYFVGTQQDHYVFKSGYVIAQVDGKAIIKILEALKKILTFHQANRFALGSFVFVILTTEKEPMNWATWFF
jgi:hypothetical protein